MSFRADINPDWLEYFELQPIIAQKLIRLGYQFHLIDHPSGTVSPYHDQPGFKEIFSKLQNSWWIINSDSEENPESIDESHKFIQSVGEINPMVGFPNTVLIRHFRDDPTRRNYFVLVSHNHNLPLYDINCILNFDQTLAGAFPIHACGIIMKNHLYLFGGPSGIGKSTLSSLSLEKGAEILDEDQLLLREDKDGGFTANAWGYSLTESHAPLRAVFKLVQSEYNKIIPLNSPQTTRFIMTQVMEMTGRVFQTDHIKNVLSFSARIARSIPGYELHFRKSPDFWKLIDAEFPVG
jgi:hypothetical protein